MTKKKKSKKRDQNQSKGFTLEKCDTKNEKKNLDNFYCLLTYCRRKKKNIGVTLNVLLGILCIRNKIKTSLNETCL